MPLPAIGSTPTWPPGLTNQDGAPVDLAKHRGTHVVLYFYPKDDTPGCTTEACNFRDNRGGIDAEIYGVSLDDAASHRTFRDKFALNFPLIVDSGKALAMLCGAVENAADVYARRVTVLLGPDGKVKATWSKVDPKQHWAEVVKAIEG